MTQPTVRTPPPPSHNLQLTGLPPFGTFGGGSRSPDASTSTAGAETTAMSEPGTRVSREAGRAVSFGAARSTSAGHAAPPVPAGLPPFRGVSVGGGSGGGWSIGTSATLGRQSALPRLCLDRAIGLDDCVDSVDVVSATNSVAFPRAAEDHTLFSVDQDVEAAAPTLLGAGVSAKVTLVEMSPGRQYAVKHVQRNAAQGNGTAFVDRERLFATRYQHARRAGRSSPSAAGSTKRSPSGVFVADPGGDPLHSSGHSALALPGSRPTVDDSVTFSASPQHLPTNPQDHFPDHSPGLPQHLSVRGASGGRFALSVASQPWSCTDQQTPLAGASSSLLTSNGCTETAAPSRSRLLDPAVSSSRDTRQRNEHVPRNVVPVKRATVHSDGSVTLVMAVMSGGHAGSDLPAPTPPGKLLRVARDVLQGLHTIHAELGLLHRDLKAANVLFDEAGTAHIADFGCCAPVECPAEDQCGTLSSMAPERLKGEPHGPPSDVWSLGLLIAQLLTGTHPYRRIIPAQRADDAFWCLLDGLKLQDSESATDDAVHALLDDLFADVRERHAAIAAEADVVAFLVDVVRRALTSDAQLRPSVPLLLADVQSFLGDVSARAAKADPRSSH